MHRRDLLKAGIVAAGLARVAQAQTTGTAAESWPTRPLHLIVADAAGRVGDDQAHRLGRPGMGSETAEREKN